MFAVFQFDSSQWWPVFGLVWDISGVFVHPLVPHVTDVPIVVFVLYCWEAALYRDIVVVEHSLGMLFVVVSLQHIPC
jgi:hypothetical protein